VVDWMASLPEPPHCVVAYHNAVVKQQEALEIK
jgi:hypothetical protein